MRLRFPLALKITAWLLLNLLLLAGLGAALLVRSGGLNWNALVNGQPGRRLQALADPVAISFGLKPRHEWPAIIAAFETEHEAAAFWFDEQGRVPADGRTVLPPQVRNRLLPARPFQREAPPPPEGPEDEAGPLRRGPGRRLAEDGPPADRRPLPQRQLVAFADSYWLAVRYEGDPLRPPGVLVIRVDSLPSLLRLLDLTSALWALAGAAVFSVLFWLPFVLGLTRSLRRLTAATGEIAEGRFDTRVEEKRSDEIGQLGASVNRMAGRLDRLVNGQKRFLGDIAHELGSPIGRMQVGTEILEDRVPPELRPAVADVREEVDQMSALVGELLDFTRAGLRPRDAALDDIPLAPLVDRVLDREAAADAVRTDIPADLSVRADADLLARALANLVRNALRYAGRERPIVLSARAEGDRAIIAVEDEGSGVPPEALARLGEPFFRPDEARTREGGGVGLGLAIVRGCAEACGGEVAFANRTPHGLRAELRLRLAERAE